MLGVIVKLSAVVSTCWCMNTREHNECLKLKPGCRDARRHQQEQLADSVKQQWLHLILLVSVKE